MTEQPNKPNCEGRNQENAVAEERFVPSINRAQAAFRVILWLLPAGFVVLSAVGLILLVSHGILPSRWGTVIFWLILNLAFVAGAGWFYGMLSCSARGESDVLYRAVQFWFFQMFLVPLLLRLLLYLASVIDPIKLGWP